MLPYGDRRRAAGRRRSDLPRHRWRGLAVAGALGVASAIAVQATQERVPAGLPAPIEQVVVPEDTLMQARSLRDEAEALTPTEVLLDERAREHWLPLAGELERTLARPDTPAPLRREIEATLAALDRVGVR
jgi:hypothetical protein